MWSRLQRASLLMRAGSGRGARPTHGSGYIICTMRARTVRALFKAVTSRELGVHSWCAAQAQPVSVLIAQDAAAAASCRSQPREASVQLGWKGVLWVAAAVGGLVSCAQPQQGRPGIRENVRPRVALGPSRALREGQLQGAA